MIWLPYASYPASVISLRAEELEEMHVMLMAMSKAFRGLSVSVKNGEVFKNGCEMFWEHQDSFFTLGLYCCVQLRNMGLSDNKHQKTWAKYWEGTRKFRRYINHPVWPDGFHQSMRDTLLQRDFDHYSEMFKAADEPFGEVKIEWPQR